ncbi:MAG: hypothetical protein P9F19_01445 [Candidatus Contendobacter sp.]|nr:hypothetical protein [Candidatus Contendobacter sp.]MDG4556054.1 hypothetical protein [Candidatus Contendobacter sp.]
MIELRPEGLERIRADFARLVPETQTQVLRGLADVAFATARDQVDTHTQTGALARSLKRPQSDGDGGWIIGHDPQMAPHAVFVHWGTRAHEIRPKDKKVLRWPSGQGGKTGFVFARFVHHPGYAGDAWLVKAADEAVRQFDAVVRRVQPPTS